MRTLSTSSPGLTRRSILFRKMFLAFCEEDGPAGDHSVGQDAWTRLALLRVPAKRAPLHFSSRTMFHASASRDPGPHEGSSPAGAARRVALGPGSRYARPGHESLRRYSVPATRQGSWEVRNTLSTSSPGLTRRSILFRKRFLHFAKKIDPRVKPAGDRRCGSAAALLRPGQARLLHDLAPAHDLGADETLQLLGRGGLRRDHAEPDDLLLHLG